MRPIACALVNLLLLSSAAALAPAAADEPTIERMAAAWTTNHPAAQQDAAPAKSPFRLRARVSGTRVFLSRTLQLCSPAVDPASLTQARIALRAGTANTGCVRRIELAQSGSLSAHSTAVPPPAVA